MAMFGWSAGDLLRLAGLAKEGYNYYQNAPETIRESFDRLQYVANDLEDLSDVLQKSGWPSYDSASKLEDDLKDAKHFFARYASLSTATTVSTSRLRDTARLGLGQDKGKLRSIDKNLKDHLEKMSAFKQHVIL
jgi:conjugal transfer/entry exclusion protein